MTNMYRNFSGIAGYKERDQFEQATTHAASTWTYARTMVCAPVFNDLEWTPPRRVETCAYCRTYQEGVGPCDSCGAKLKLSQLSEPW
jgi:hypothetical protein